MAVVGQRARATTRARAAGWVGLSIRERFSVCGLRLRALASKLDLVRLGLDAHGLGLVALLLVLAGVPLLISPVGEFPVDDDWSYAQAVRQLLLTGTYQRSVWIDTAFMAQGWWGVLVAHVLGFSHTSLRVGTMLLSAVAVVASYALLARALHPSLALATTLLLLVHPVFLHLSYTFMTDVPFLAVMLAALWCVSVALEPVRQPPRVPEQRLVRLGWLAVGSALIGLACLVRQIGIVLAPAVLLAALPELSALRASRWWLLAVLVVPCGAVLVGGALWDGPRDVGVESRFLDLLLASDPTSLVQVAQKETAASLALLGLSTVPAAPLIWSRVRLKDWSRWQRLLAVVLLSILAWAIGGRVGAIEYGAAPALLALVVALPWRWVLARAALPSRLGSAVVPVLLTEVLALAVVTSNRAGASLSPLFGNTLSAAGFTTSGLHPHAIALDVATLSVLAALGLIGSMTLVLALAEAVRSPTRGRCAARTSAAQRPGVEPPSSLSIRLLVLSSLGILAATLAYGPIGGPVNGVYDRYLLPVLPGVLALVAFVVRERRLALPLFLAGATVFAGWSVAWEREYLARQQAVWTAAEALVEAGIPATAIDAGYEWAGWTRGDLVIEQARAAALQAGEPRQFVQLVVDGLYRPSDWYIGFGPLGWGCAGQPQVTVPYGDGFAAYGLRRCRPQPRRMHEASDAE